MFFGGGKCLIFEVQLLAVDHAVAASPHAQCLCGTDTDLSRSRSVCNGVECFRQQDIAGQHGSGFRFHVDTFTFHIRSDECRQLRILHFFRFKQDTSLFDFGSQLLSSIQYAMFMAYY